MGAEEWLGLPSLYPLGSTGTEMPHKPATSKLTPSCPPAPCISSALPVRERVGPGAGLSSRPWAGPGQKVGAEGWGWQRQALGGVLS